MNLNFFCVADNFPIERRSLLEDVLEASRWNKVFFSKDADVIFISGIFSPSMINSTAAKKNDKALIVALVDSSAARSYRQRCRRKGAHMVANMPNHVREIDALALKIKRRLAKRLQESSK